MSFNLNLNINNSPYIKINFIEGDVYYLGNNWNFLIFEVLDIN